MKLTIALTIFAASLITGVALLIADICIHLIK